MVYELKQYDKTLIIFEIVSNHLEGVECRITSVGKDNEYLLPYGLTVSGDGILFWYYFGDSLLSCNGGRRISVSV